MGALIFPYVNWKGVFSRRALRTTFRGLRQYLAGPSGKRRVHGWRLFYRMRVEVMLRSHKPIRGITQFPVAKLWVDQEAFPRIKKLILRARHTVFIQMFIWKDDQIGREMAEVLVEVADRGVNVVINKEAVGDIFEAHRDFLGTKNDTAGIWKRFWAHRNIRAHHETHNDHAKVYIIDDRIFLLSGMNIADEYHREWHDYLVELRGKRFVEHYLTGDGLDLPGEARLVMNTEQRKDIRSVLTDLIAFAKSSIVIEHCYLSDTAVVDQLIQRSKDGIRIVIILPNQKDFHHYANMHSITRLFTEGARKRVSVFLYPRILHAKIMLVDREWAFVGSANLITSSIDDMGEVNVLLHGTTHAAAIRKLRDVLREDILLSTPMDKVPRFHWLWRWLIWFKM